jgi:uncharacterized membrane protein YcaP (DUF421 family)
VGARRAASLDFTIPQHLVHFAVLDKTVRTIAVYAAIFLLLRVAGKRELASLTTFDLVVLLLLSNVVQNAIIGPDDSLLGGLFAALLLVLGNYLVVRFAFFHQRFGRVLQGRESVLVEGGHIQRPALRRELIGPRQLDSVLRRMGLDGVGDVERVVLEPEGTLTPTRKPEPGIEEVLERLDRIERKLG